MNQGIERLRLRPGLGMFFYDNAKDCVRSNAQEVRRDPNRIYPKPLITLTALIILENGVDTLPAGRTSDKDLIKWEKK